MGDILAYRRTAMGKGSPKSPRAVAEAVAFGADDVLADRDPGDTSTAPGSHEETEAATAALVTELTGAQERLYAEGVGGGRRSLLLLLQGMDTSGKDGTVRRVVGAMNPAGVRISSFKKPTAEELSHDFLWRIDNALPEPGDVGVFNRSQYEDVLVVRVHDLVPESEWSTRYDRINEFEHRVVDAGTHIVKVMLHISKEEQKQRLAERLEDPSKYWKYKAGDLTERAFWDDYQAAYQDALARCSTDAAPWYVVPGDRKWYRDWVVTNLLVAAMRDMNPVYPPAAFDVTEQRRLVAALD
jgi:PPK2 family polyphosphate:nucleotide phosphotransferase